MTEPEQPPEEPEPLERRADVEDLFARAGRPMPRSLSREARTLARHVSEAGKTPPPGPILDGPGPGTWIGERYQLIEELGRGGVGTVYLGRDNKFDAQVAVKVAVPASDQSAHDFRARFEREARFSYLLGTAPGIVRTLDWGQLEDGKTLFLVMDLVEDARPLDLRTGPRGARLGKLDRAAALVAWVHDHQIVHRDIKPGNFLVSSGKRVHLTDFGAAKSLSDSAGVEPVSPVTLAGVLIGTPHYMAPEQFNHPGNVGPTADVYALGVMLYRCLTEAYPYPGENAVEFIASQLRVRYEVEAGPARPLDVDATIHPALDELCMSAIDQEPERRPQDAGAFLRLLRRCRRPSGMTPRARPAKAPPKKPSEATGAPGVARELWTELGVDLDGFAPWERLRKTFRDRGAAGFEALLGDVPALRVIQERPVEGRVWYEGRVGFLLSRETHEPALEVTLGRTRESDLAVSLVSVSKLHARFLRRGSTWHIVDAGSINGSSLNGSPLEAHRERALADRDVIQLSQHLSLQLLLPESLTAIIGEET